MSPLSPLSLPNPSRICTRAHTHARLKITPNVGTVGTTLDQGRPLRSRRIKFSGDRGGDIGTVGTAWAAIVERVVENARTARMKRQRP
jgi:hypothetical protein